jgi:hypothetical protein
MFLFIKKISMKQVLLTLFSVIVMMPLLLAQPCTAPDHTFCYDNSLTSSVELEVCPAPGVTLDLFITQGETEGCCDDLTVYSGAAGSGTTGAVVLATSAGDFSGTALQGANPGDCLIFVIDSDGSVSCQSGSQDEFQIYETATPVVPGCQDPLASNFDPLATCDDGSCVFAPANDNCDGAFPVTVNADETCDAANNVSGTITGATQSPESATDCFGTEDDDVWFSFVATQSTHNIDLLNIANGTSDLYHSVYEGTCPGGLSLVAGSCSDPNSSTVSGLTATNTYYIRVYSWTSTTGQTTDFDVCVNTPPGPPANDDCGALTAVTLSANDCGTPVAGTTVSSTQSLPGCIGTANDDVWYQFTASATEHIIEVANTGGTTDIVTEVLDACGGTSLVCQDTPNSPIEVTGLTIGNVYYFRIYTWSSSSATTTSFTVCVTEVPSCPEPTDLSVGTITGSTASVSWTSGGGAVTTTTVTVCDAGDQPGDPSCTEFTSALSPQGITGLTGCESYDVFVREICGAEQSEHAGPVSFTAEPPAPDLTPTCGTTVDYPCPGGSATYPVADLQTWTLTPSAGMHVKVTMNYVDIETNGFGCWDFIEITGLGPGGVSTGEICGEGDGDGGTGTGLAAGDCFYHPVAGESVTILFDSDGSVQETGFSFTFECLSAADAAECGGVPMASFSLPITIASFEAKAMDRGNKIMWSTANEVNNHMQIVQASTDGRSNWYEVGSIRSEGNSNTSRSYEIMDDKPGGITYYRIYSVDLDASTQLSEVISVKRARINQVLSMYPNPASAHVNLDIEVVDEQVAMVSIVDLVGQVVYQSTESLAIGTNKLQVDIADLPTGVYIMSINGNQLGYTKKLMVE